MFGDGNGRDYPMAEVGTVCGPRRSSLTEKLKERKSSLEKQLAEVTSAVDALEKSPELQNLLDIVSRVA